MTYISDSEEFQKKKSFLIRQNQGRFLFEKYQKELQWLFPDYYESCKILQLSHTDLLIETARSLPDKFEVIKIHTDFDNKDLLQDIVRQLYNLYDKEVYFVGEYAEYCGATILPNIDCWDTNFPCTFEYSEIFGFWTVDLENFLLVDFGEEDDEIYLELEIKGESWNKKNITVDN
jgi:hypothetical protein